jgi:hypothetical protein
MKSAIFLAIAASFNGIMDTLWTHYDRSVFKALDPKWWNPNLSWMHQENFLGLVRLDAWHLAKYGMLFGICLAIITYKPIVKKYRILDFFIFTCIWSIFFELFYSYLLLA